MSTIIPVGGAVAILRFSLLGDLEPMITTIGLQEAQLPDGEAMADELYEIVTSPGGIATDEGIIVGYTFLGTTIMIQTPGGFSSYEHNGPQIGTQAGSVVPSNCALLVHKNSNTGGRRGNGRMYFPPYNFTEANVDARGQLNSLSFLQPQFNEFFARLIAAVELPPPVIYHDDGSPGTIITGFTIDPVIGTQRGRMR